MSALSMFWLLVINLLIKIANILLHAYREDKAKSHILATAVSVDFFTEHTKISFILTLARVLESVVLG